MATTNAIADPRPSHTIASKLRDYYTSDQARSKLADFDDHLGGLLSRLSAARLTVGRLISTLVGTLLVASGTATLNQLMERLYDAQMRRTANRPSGLRQTQCSGGFLVRAFAECRGRYVSCDGGQRAVGFAGDFGTLLGYLLVYTPLKRKTPLCTLLGAVPGAMPTLIGWAGSLRRYRSKGLVSFRNSFSVAVPSFPGDCADVP